MTHFEGWGEAAFRPTMRSAYETADPKGEQMTAVVLKRKLRNFPSGKLSERLAAA
jgi:hypothetical protein